MSKIFLLTYLFRLSYVYNGAKPNDPCFFARAQRADTTPSNQRVFVHGDVNARLVGCAERPAYDHERDRPEMPDVHRRCGFACVSWRDSRTRRQESADSPVR